MEFVGALARDTRTESDRVGVIIHHEDEWFQVEFGAYRVWIPEAFIEFVEEELNG